MDATDNSMSGRVRKSGLLYPMMVIAAIAVIVFSGVGIATMMGWMPGALSRNEPAMTAPASPPAYANAPSAAAKAPRAPASAPRTVAEPAGAQR